MTNQEFKQALKELDDNYIRKKQALISDYAKTNQLYNVGDLIENRVTKERIKIQDCKVSPLPEIYYTGVLLVKDDFANERGINKLILQDYAVLIKKGENNREVII
jgi:hypothetical protein